MGGASVMVKARGAQQCVVGFWFLIFAFSGFAAGLDSRIKSDYDAGEVAFR